MNRQPGFTLSELLIALAILGVIATFTIPKVLQAQQGARYNAIAKEAAGMITGAYDAYRLEHTPTANTIPRDLTPYMNYLRVDTTSVVDRYYGQGTNQCGTGYECLVLHSGAILLYNKSENFCGTGNNVIYFYLDPDGIPEASPTGPGKSVLLFLYYNGRLTTWANITPGAQAGQNGACNQVYGPLPTADPPWFSWD